MRSLREALQQKIGAWKHEQGGLYWASQELDDLLKTFPRLQSVDQGAVREVLNQTYMAGMRHYNSGKITPPQATEILDDFEARLLLLLGVTDD